MSLLCQDMPALHAYLPHAHSQPVMLPLHHVIKSIVPVCNFSFATLTDRLCTGLLASSNYNRYGDLHCSLLMIVLYHVVHLRCQHDNII